MTFMGERKNILIISIVVLAAVLLIYFAFSNETQESDLGILDDQIPSFLDDLEESETTPGSYSEQEEITIPEGTEFYCEWVWPQKIINKETGEVYWTCPSSKPYCKSGTSECCQYNSVTEEHYNCVEMNN